MAFPSLQHLAPFGVTAFICFLAFTSQLLFHYVEPGPLRKGDAYIFNALVLCLLVTYYRTCTLNPGRIPNDWDNTLLASSTGETDEHDEPLRQRWCRKCEIYKPPRAHHCKTCKRCVMKMDHHCVWTANCISHVTFPHFVRFLFYTFAAMIYLEVFLYQRAAILWQKRNLPSYLGPNVVQLAHLFILIAANSLVAFAIFLLLGRTIWSLAGNMTTIESWEVERHHAVLRRARVLGGYLDAPDGSKVKIVHQEFPWDVGIWANICQGMGSNNPLAWFWPFAKSPSVESGLSFEHNEIDDPSKPWPPPDPDRLFRAARRDIASGDGFVHSMDPEAFRQRQAADLTRFEDADGEYVIRRKPFHERIEETMRRDETGVYEIDEDAILTDDEESDYNVGPLPAIEVGQDEGEEAWRNKEGERLADFGVDEVAEFYDEEDDLPLSEIIKRRKRV